MLSKTPTSMKFTLAALAVAAAGMAANLAWAAPGGHGPGHHGEMAMEGGGMHRGAMFMGERMLSRVNATAEQKAQIRAIMEAAHKDMEAQREAGKALRERGMQLFTQPNIDAAAIESLRQQMTAHQEQRSKRMSQAMVDAAKVLTPEQRKQLGEMANKRRDMMERHHRERQNLEAPKS